MQNEIKWYQSIDQAKPDYYFATCDAIRSEAVALARREGSRWLWKADGETGYEESLDAAQNKAEETVQAMLRRLGAEKAE